MSRRIFIAALLSALMGLAAPSVQAASSGQLTISGTVALVSTVAVTANGTNNVNLSISGGETGKNVASVLETSNDALGYVISVSSANGGQLVLQGQATVKTAYQISYDGGSYAQPSAAGATVKTVSSLSGLTTHSSVVLVNVTAFPAAPAGSYSDLITVSIVAN